MKASEIDDHDEDYHRLVNTVERHTRCSAAYCLKKKHAGAPCQLNAGLDFQSHWKQIQNWLIRNYHIEDIDVDLVIKRNDHRLNSHNRVMLEKWYLTK